MEKVRRGKIRCKNCRYEWEKFLKWFLISGDGRVWARIIDGVEKEDLQPLIENKVKKGTVVCSDTWRGYTGIATKGYLHKLVNHSEGEYVNKEGNHINGLEGFLGY